MGWRWDVTIYSGEIEKATREDTDMTTRSAQQHSFNNLEPMAALARHQRKRGFVEAVCLPDGAIAVMEISESVQRPSGTFWLVWAARRKKKRETPAPIWVTSTALRAAVPYTEWAARRARTDALI